MLGIKSYITVDATLDTEDIEKTELRVFEIDIADGFFVSISFLICFLRALPS